MYTQTFPVQVDALSAYYSIDSSLNLYPRLGLRTPGTQTEGNLPTLSPSVRAFLTACHEDVVALANKPAVRVPKVPDDLPLKHYFISSSHNTYLLGWQIFGRSSPAAYTHVLLASSPARCIEIDVWWDGRPGHGLPVVTHGWTLSKSVPFVDVCMAIGEAVKRISDEEGGRNWPVFVSLECHIPLAYQDELVRIMIECWGDMLVQGKIEGMDGETVTPRQLRGRIVLMVEYYPDETINQHVELDTEREALDAESWVILEDERDRDSQETVDVSSVLAYPRIADSLANLGFYARSMKPPKSWWSQIFPHPPHPPNVTLNVNERYFPSLPQALPALQKNAAYHLRRAYPHGLRLTSSNLDPLIQWQSGTHMACLNWQKWDEAMWLNEAMFVGTGGWVVRPDPKCTVSGPGKRWWFTGRVVGLSALPRPEGYEHDFEGYCQADLIHRDEKYTWQSNLARDPHNAVSLPEARPNDADAEVVHLTWDETFQWTLDADALSFLQLRVVRRHTLGRDETVAVFCARLDQLVSGWCLVRLLDMRGKFIGATLLCEFRLAHVLEDEVDSDT